ncbi:Na+/H+ antiporter NhaA, partial [Enterococcus faecalis]|uniref:Na+/H+ antiporter NhaA n=1 Tax=Enterococcus faecalis TaxID=1351 RepID=UPI003D6A57A8
MTRAARPSRTRNPFAALAHRLEPEVFSGLLMVTAALAALVWANSPWRDAYETLST